MRGDVLALLVLSQWSLSFLPSLVCYLPRGFSNLCFDDKTEVLRTACEVTKNKALRPNVSRKEKEVFYARY